MFECWYRTINWIKIACLRTSVLINFKFRIFECELRRRILERKLLKQTFDSRLKSSSDSSEHRNKTLIRNASNTFITLTEMVGHLADGQHKIDHWGRWIPDRKLFFKSVSLRSGLKCENRIHRIQCDWAMPSLLSKLWWSAYSNIVFRIDFQSDFRSSSTALNGEIHYLVHQLS